MGDQVLTQTPDVRVVQLYEMQDVFGTVAQQSVDEQNPDGRAKTPSQRGGSLLSVPDRVQGNMTPAAQELGAEFVTVCENAFGVVEGELKEKTTAALAAVEAQEETMKPEVEATEAATAKYDAACADFDFKKDASQTIDDAETDAINAVSDANTEKENLMEEGQENGKYSIPFSRDLDEACRGAHCAAGEVAQDFEEFKEFVDERHSGVPASKLRCPDVLVNLTVDTVFEDVPNCGAVDHRSGFSDSSSGDSVPARKDSVGSASSVSASWCFSDKSADKGAAVTDKGFFSSSSDDSDGSDSDSGESGCVEVDQFGHEKGSD